MNLHELVEQKSLELKEKTKDMNALIQNIPGGVMCCEYTRELSCFLSVTVSEDDGIYKKGDCRTVSK